jgi:hypothetical protein
MSKELRLREVKRGVQLVLIERDASWRIRRQRTFTVPRFDFEEACRDAGLVVTVTVDPTTTEAKEARLRNEIAWYAKISEFRDDSGRPTVKSQRERLWARITAKLNLG